MSDLTGALGVGLKCQWPHLPPPLATIKFRSVDVSFKRTGERRYAVIVENPGKNAQLMDPAPGYDDDIPHDLVHYIVEAELRLLTGVFGRAAQGGGTFIEASDGTSSRERARQRRKQRRREESFRANAGNESEIAASERLAAVCDVAFRRRRGQRPDPGRTPPDAVSGDDAAKVERVVRRLEALAPLWRALPIGGALVFEWPNVEPRR